MPYSGPAAPPTVDTSVIPAVLSSGPSGASSGRPRSAVADGGQLRGHRLHPAVHVDAVVGVADGGVEVRQLVAAGRDLRGERAQPGGDARRVDDAGRGAHAPHRRPGVSTGASHSRSSSSSSRSSVIEQPAMSSAVM